MFNILIENNKLANIITNDDFIVDDFIIPLLKDNKIDYNIVNLDNTSKKQVGSVINSVFTELDREIELEGIQEENKERQEEIDIPKPRHLNSYKHRNNTRTIDIDENQVQNIPSIDEELAELDRFIKMKEALLKKKKDSEMC